MKGLRFCLVPAILAGAIFAGPVEAQTLRVGLAEADITPPPGFPMAGYYHERRANGTIDPLKARAIVWQDGKTRAALVVCDLIGIAVDLTGEVRRQVAARTGIPAAHVVVTATHAHTGPDYARDLYDHLGQDQAAGKEAYSARLIAGIVEAVVTANKRARPAVLEAGLARQETPVSFNRRFVMKDGSVQTWKRLDEPGVVRPAGPIDPQIGLVLMRAAEGKEPRGVLSNFALHLDTVGGTRWSADYPAFLERGLRQKLGPEVVSVFGTGCCGDINHVDPSRKVPNKTDVIGRALAGTVEQALPRLKAVERPVLRVRRATVPVPLQEVTVEQVARARSLLPEARAGKKVNFLEHVAAYKAMLLDQLRHKKPHARSAEFLSWGLTHTWAGVGDRLPVEVQVIALGDDVALVFLPGEIFVELGLAIKQASPFRTTLVIELANSEETLYVPTRAAYAGGSYEVTNSALQPGSGEMLVEAALRLLREVATEAARP